MKTRMTAFAAIVAALALGGILAGCSPAAGSSSSSAAAASSSSAAAAEESASASGSSADAESYAVPAGLLAGEKMFTARDLAQTADTSAAVELAVQDGQDLTISEEGVYVVSGTAADATIIVEADENAKVQIVLDGVSITNGDAPAIYVKSADKVFVTLAGDNSLAVTGAFAADGETNVDAAIFSKDDLVLNGTGSLSIDSTANAITSKDDLKVTGGTYSISCAGNALEANDSIAVRDGSFSIAAGKDGLHSSNDENDEDGYVYVCGGSFDVTAASDGIHAGSAVQIDGGTFDLNAPEGIEGTYVQVNGGAINISATDDGINATAMSTAYGTVIEITGGDVTIEMAQGDTDALDSNGDLRISGGTVDITAQFAFDFDGAGELTGGSVTVNGEQVTELANSMMGGRGGQGGMRR